MRKLRRRKVKSTGKTKFLNRKIQPILEKIFTVILSSSLLFFCSRTEEDQARVVKRNNRPSLKTEKKPALKDRLKELWYQLYRKNTKVRLDAVKEVKAIALDEKTDRKTREDIAMTLCAASNEKNKKVKKAALDAVEAIGSDKKTDARLKDVIIFFISRGPDLIYRTDALPLVGSIAVSESSNIVTRKEAIALMRRIIMEESVPSNYVAVIQIGRIGISERTEPGLRERISNMLYLLSKEGGTNEHLARSQLGLIQIYKEAESKKTNPLLRKRIFNALKKLYENSSYFGGTEHYKEVTKHILEFFRIAMEEGIDQESRERMLTILKRTARWHSYSVCSMIVLELEKISKNEKTEPGLRKNIKNWLRKRPKLLRKARWWEKTKLKRKSYF